MALQIQHKATDLPEKSFVVTITPEDSSVKRKCHECQRPTLKTVVSLSSHVENIPDFKAHRRVYVCSECGAIDVQS